MVDRSTLIRRAASLPESSPERQAILATLKEASVWGVLEPKPGQTYTITTRHQKSRTTPWVARFLRYEVRSGTVLMWWEDGALGTDPNHLPGFSEPTHWETDRGKWAARLSGGVVIAPDQSPLIVLK